MAHYSIIAAVGENWEIGCDGWLPWNLPDDMSHFKELTSGHTVIMGRKTWETLTVRPLPQRRNIVLTSSPDNLFHGAETASNVCQAVAMTENSANEVFVIGGAAVFANFADIADKIYLTRVHGVFAADTFFPIQNLKNWHIIEEEFLKKNDINNFDLTFQTYAKYCK